MLMRSEVTRDSALMFDAQTFNIQEINKIMRTEITQRIIEGGGLVNREGEFSDKVSTKKPSCVITRGFRERNKKEVFRFE